jgi:N-acetylmuramoyl-L-alanine amidase
MKTKLHLPLLSIRNIIVLYLCFATIFIPHIYGGKKRLSSVKTIYGKAVKYGEKEKKLKLVSYNRQIYISVNDLTTLYGGKLQWYPVSGKVVYEGKKGNATFYINSRQIKLDDKVKNLSSPTIYINRCLYLPVEAVASSPWKEITGVETFWIKDRYILLLSEKVDVFLPQVIALKNLTKVIVEFNKDVKYNIVSSTDELKIIFPNTVYIQPAEKKTLEFPGTPVKTISIKEEKNVKGINISLQKNMLYSIEKQEKKIIVFITPQEEFLITSTATLTQATTFNNLLFTNTTATITMPVSEKKNPIRIVIDPGHGGDNAGAIGPSGIPEKDINLQLAKRLSLVLTENYGYETILTREDDIFIPLHERTIFANKERGNIFISIHCNASPNNPSADGFEVYFLSEEATDKAAEEIAKYENAVIEMENISLTERQAIEKILFSIATNIYMNASAELAGYIVDAVKKEPTVKVNGVRQANFYVLRGANMPAVLIETEYLSNPIKEKLLAQYEFQKAIMDRCAEGIDKFIRSKFNK